MHGHNRLDLERLNLGRLELGRTVGAKSSVGWQRPRPAGSLASPLTLVTLLVCTLVLLSRPLPLAAETPLDPPPPLHLHTDPPLLEEDESAHLALQLWMAFLSFATPLGPLLELDSLLQQFLEAEYGRPTESEIYDVIVDDVTSLITDFTTLTETVEPPVQILAPIQ